MVMNKNSIEAYKSIESGRMNFHRKIKAALSKIGSGTFRTIAKKAGLRDDQVWRRLSEMERKNQIERNGSITDSVTGRSVTLWKIVTRNK